MLSRNGVLVVNIKNLKIKKKIIPAILFGGISALTLSSCGEVNPSETSNAEISSVAESNEASNKENIHIVVFGEDTAVVINPSSAEFTRSGYTWLTMDDYKHVVLPLERAFVTDEPYDKLEELIYALKGSNYSIQNFEYDAQASDYSQEQYYALAIGKDTTTVFELYSYPNLEAECYDLTLKNGSRFIVPSDDIIIASLPEEDCLRLANCLDGDNEVIYYDNVLDKRKIKK